MAGFLCFEPHKRQGGALSIGFLPLVFPRFPAQHGAMTQRVVIHWGLSSLHGWGVYGLNLAMAWAGDEALEAATDYEIALRHVTLDPLQWHALAGFQARSAKLRAQLLRQKSEPITVNAVVLSALGNDLQPQPGPHGGALLGRPSFGTIFFEREALGAKTRETLATHAAIIAGSSWNAAVLRAHGLPRVELVLQGIDPALFHPAPRRGLFPGRFVVFSGGKLEARKGQDNVIAAWRIFAARHPDALLISAWHNHWPEGARSIDASRRAASLPFRAAGTPDSAAWVAANGIRAEQFHDLGVVPNALMPAILREADAALFPNRCEGGTNLVAMEAMACGVPCILSANTGHLDLIKQGTALALADQRPIHGVPGWRESNIEEIVAALEALYTDRARAAAIGATGAQLLSGLTWAKTASEMKRIISAL
ncbi:MAG: glycosyltransferase family 4 protein [Roseomonas sp.]|nr:glycosyltransferase family 4 protein [Roseomonas sp.]